MRTPCFGDPPLDVIIAINYCCVKTPELRLLIFMLKSQNKSGIKLAVWKTSFHVTVPL